MRIVVVGGGLVGTCFALEAHARGAQVAVLDRTGLHAEASTAGAGILGASAEAMTGDHDAADVVRAREAMFKWLPHLESRSGLPIRAARRGTLVRVRDEDERRRFAHWLEGHPGEGKWLPFHEVLELVPGLAACPLGAVLFEDDGSLEPARLGSAVAVALRAASVEVRCGVAVSRLLIQQGRAEGVLLASGERVAADAVVLAAGAWSGGLLATAGLADDVIPVRGQLLELRPAACDLRPVVFEGKRYIVPRGDGRFVVGSTMEHAGFDSGTTSEARGELLAFAERLVPSLVGAEIAGHWAGLRPVRPGGPRVGRAPIEGLFTSFGHGRNGILSCRKSALDLADLLELPPPEAS